MEYGQERIATLHDLTGHVPDAPTERAAVVVPMTDREYAGLAAERVLSPRWSPRGARPPTRYRSSRRGSRDSTSR